MTSWEGQSDIDHVRDATDLVRLIGEHIALRPKGREHVGMCPFHDDHKPSLAVVTHKGHAFYKCFACGASGDAFRFVQDFHKMDFPEALRYLADRAGITLTPRKSRPAASPDAPGRSDLLKAAEFAATFFKQNLEDPTIGQAAREVISKRGISEEMTKQFMIGAAPTGYGSFLQRLGGKPSAIRTAFAAGLLKQRGDDPTAGDYYDAFRNRLVFPILDDLGRVVAFGGRIIDPDDVPKYLNSSESAVFRKSKTLFGLHQAKRAIIESKHAIVTEGYTDVIACHQAGITNAVGTMGTALTKEHAGVLSRLCDTVVLVFDGDEAGQKAADRGLEVFFAEPVDVKICVLPNNLDPDELLKQEDGFDRFLEAVNGAVGALEFKSQRVRARLGDSSGISSSQKQLEQFMSELADLGFSAVSGVRKRLIYNEIADLFKVSLAHVEKALPNRVRPRRSQPAIPAAAVGDEGPNQDPSLPEHMLLPEEFAQMPITRARRIAERDLLSVLLFEPSAGIQSSPFGGGKPRSLTEVITKGQFADPLARRIAETVFPWLENGISFTMPQLLAEFADDETRAVASDMFIEGRRQCAGDEINAGERLLAASETLLRQVRAEQSDRCPAGVESDSVIELINKRKQQGDRPAAISHGVRS